MDRRPSCKCVLFWMKTQPSLKSKNLPLKFRPLHAHSLQVTKWRGLAARHEAAFAEAAAKLHSREAASLAASSQQQVRGTCAVLSASGACVHHCCF